MTEPLISDRVSPNHGPRQGAAIDMLILHYTGMSDAKSALDRLCDAQAEVSAHYLIEEDGAIWRLIPEHRRAWHAGQSFWAGATDINSRSIGIEIVNPGHGPDYRPFSEPQMVSLEFLCRQILLRHPIPAHRVLGHSDIAPARKCDPGELFDWRRLAGAGIGLWSDAGATDRSQIEDFATGMRKFGYADSSADSIAAFQRHFRARSISGVADAECAARLADLIRKAGLA